MEARDWVAARGALTPEQLWAQCERADWLLWYAARVGVDRRAIVRAACACARTVLHLVPEGEERPLSAIETAEAWCDGRATTEQVRYARLAASAAAYAAYADADADAVYAADAAAAYADADADADASAERTRLVRELIPYAVVAAAREAWS
jgi:hypothetical protein